MISNQQYSTEPVAFATPDPYGVEALEPFETELRSHLHDILEEWEEQAYLENPLIRSLIFEMIDQISDAMYPPEEEDADV